MEVERAGNKVFAVEWLKLAKEDLRAAESLLKDNNFNNSVYHSQQACEKAVKALLEINKIIVRSHYVSQRLLSLGRSDDILKIAEAAEWFEKDRKWEITRYPIEKGKEIFLPFKVFSEKDAKEAFEKAKFVVEKIEKILKEKYGVEVK